MFAQVRIARWPLHLGAVRDGMFWHMLCIIACLAPTGAHAIYFQSVCVLSFSRRTVFVVRRAFRVPSFVLAAFSLFIATGDFLFVLDAFDVKVMHANID